MAPRAGLEPATLWLTARCSAIELSGNINSRNDLLSQRAAPQVPSALEGLTTVFGMGTGVTLPPLSRETY